MIGTEAESSTGESPSARLDRVVRTGTPVLRIPGRNRTKADIVVYRDGGRMIAVKDYGRRPLWIRASIGRLLVARECAAYRAAEGSDGLPRFLGRLSPHALALEWIDGPTLADRPALAADPRLHARLLAIVESLHRRGVALGDLHHRDVVVAEDGVVRIVDLATAWVAPAGASRWRRRVFERLREQDRIALARIEARGLGRAEAEALAGLDPSAVRRYLAARKLKGWWDRLRGRSASR